jgi:transposase-like protein
MNSAAKKTETPSAMRRAIRYRRDPRRMPPELRARRNALIVAKARDPDISLRSIARDFGLDEKLIRRIVKGVRT